MEEKNRQLNDIKKLLKQREKHNLSLDIELKELNVAVNERRHIDQVNGELICHFKMVYK